MIATLKWSPSTLQQSTFSLKKEKKAFSQLYSNNVWEKILTTAFYEIKGYVLIQNSVVRVKSQNSQEILFYLFQSADVY